MPMIDSGIIVVNKSAGMTSAAVVASIRHFLGMRRVGHTGTLDPFATGVLPVVFGRATSAAHYMLRWTKRYRCLAALGASTDTMDRDGQVTARAPEGVLPYRDAEKLRKAVESLTGITEQRAPLYSAIKRNGKPLYAYAREGLDVERPVREIAVFESKLHSLVEGEDGGYTHLLFECHVSAGTYIRALVDTLGRRLGTFAYAETLERVATGPFSLLQSVALEDLSDRFEAAEGDRARWLHQLEQDGLLLPVGAAFASWPRVLLTAEEALAVTHGQTPTFTHPAMDPDDEIVASAPPPEGRWAALFYEDELIAVAEDEGGRYRLRRVFRDPSFFGEKKRPNERNEDQT